MEIGINDTFLLNDSQHRKAAIIEAIGFAECLKDETIVLDF